MKRIGLLLLVAIFQPGFVACARDHGRVKKKPTPVAAERLASDMVMNDSNIVSTDRGLYRSRGPDGHTNDFVRVPNPVSPRFP